MDVKETLLPAEENLQIELDFICLSPAILEKGFFFSSVAITNSHQGGERECQARKTYNLKSSLLQS